ncbi:filamentous hemagglutinin N-terminal domain-containing protein [Floridanema aerugineum]|uniref:Filamentous hemagglutinin N-terminal domain-containing protein n=1 Tax=Floridaenema aerugineum BLCC-F46 TaxID=3153654 RepID=A0ABV4X0M6_9CYAN
MKLRLCPFWLCSGSTLFFLYSSKPTAAQIVPDATLPINSTVIQQGNNSVIEGGTTAGTNLFHSFKSFSVPTNGSAFFNNATNIQNIFSRVTGGSVSNIDGLIKANGIANLFLINPNGIIFGPNARLNIGGSFLASTANSFKFADGVEFSATNPQGTPLLSINVPIGLQYGKNSGDIRIQGKGQEFGLNGVTESFDSSLNPLEVNPGKTLTFVGGNLVIDGGILQSPGGRIQLGAAAGETTVGLNADGSLSFPDGMARADISIANKAGINVLAAGGGSITISGRSIDISQDSLLSTGIATGKGTTESIAGRISLDAIEAITIDSSRIENKVNPDAIGNSGSINIAGESLYLTNNAQLDASTFGQGKAGSVTIIARDTVSFNGSSAYTSVKEGAKGDGGNINITTKSLFANNGARLNANISGTGNGGSVNITASGNVSFDGVNGNPTAALTNVEETGKGNAGDVNIKAVSLEVTNKALLESRTRGKGNAGDVNIIASDTVSFDDAGAYSSVESTAKGNGGNINITALSILVNNEAKLFSRTKSDGNSGNINITANDVFVTGGSHLAASGNGTGDAGKITINARNTVSFTTDGAAFTDVTGKGKGGDINISAELITLKNGVRLFSRTEGEGNSGNINITANDVFITDNSRLAASANGTGDAGKITINAGNSIYFDTDGLAFTNVTGKGNGGDINITAKSITLKNGSRLNAGISGEGKGGSINITASGKVYFDGESNNGTTAALTNVEETGKGNAGDVNIKAASLEVTNGALLESRTRGKGNAGDVNIIASDIVSFDNAGAYSSVESGAKGQGGNINIQTRSLSAKNDAGLFTSTENQGNAGSIIIKASDHISLNNSLIASTVEEGAVGNGGDINIQAESLLVTNGAQIQTFVRGNDSDSQLSGRGNAGNVNITVRDQVSIDNSSVLSGLGPGVVGQDGGVGKGGSINIKAESLSLSNGAVLEAIIRPKAVGEGSSINITTGSLSITKASLLVLVEGTGKAGNITINARDSINFNGGSASSRVADKAVGNGGNINITTGSLSVTNANLLVSVEGTGNAGSITINAQDSVTFNGGRAESSVARGAEGNGSGINITTESLNLTNGAQLRVNTAGKGNAGSMNIKAQQFSMSSNAALIGDVDPTGKGQGGDVKLNVTGTILLIGGETAETGESTRITLGVLPNGIGKGGNLIVDTGSFILKDGAIVKISSQGQGEAGSITIRAALVDISGSVPESGLPSGLFTSTDTAFQAGDITVNARTFRIADGAALSARSKGDGQGGNIKVNATSFEALNGGQLITTTFAQGKAGNIFVNAKDRVIISGSDPNYNSRIAKFPAPISSFVANAIKETGAASGFFAGTETKSTGRGGGIFITTGELITRNGAQISVNSQGTGEAGNINTTARSILLSNKATLSANTKGGQGNIELRSRSLILRRESRITTDASGTVEGGNITLNNGVLAALENSDISANAEEGRGGRINIDAQAIFGAKTRTREELQRLLNPDEPLDPTRLLSSDITAISQKGGPQLEGSITLNTPDVDPNSGLLELSVDFVDPTQLIATGCPAAQGNSFTVTGRGGLPPLPNEPLRPNNTISVYWVGDTQEQKSSDTQTQRSIPPTTNYPLLTTEKNSEIVEATGWVRDNKGQVVLITSTPSVITNSTSFIKPSCP